MSKERILSSILDTGILPIVRANSGEQALQAAGAIHRGGIRTLEIAMTVPGAVRVLEKVADKYGDEIILGAGTILDAETARICILAGAQFLVSPSLSIPTIEMSNRYSKISIPGALTPTEVHRAWEAGADLVKIFPIGNIGGPSYLRALKAPLPQVLMMPTGGVGIGNVSEFFAAGASAVAVGSDIVSTQALTTGDYPKIEHKAQEFLSAVLKVKQQQEAD